MPQPVVERHLERPQAHAESGPAGADATVRAIPGETEPAAHIVEERLLDFSRQGDIKAFGLVIEPYYSTCLKRACAIFRNRGDAEDEVQNAFCKAFHRLNQFRGEGAFGAWLSRIVENQCLMRIREMRQCQFVYLDETSEANVKLELVGQAENPEDQLGTQQVKDLLRREISRMPSSWRDVILLHDVQQLPMHAVARRLGLTVPAAKSRLTRGRAEMRLRLAKHCGPKGGATLIDRGRRAKLAYARGA